MVERAGRCLGSLKEEFHSQEPAHICPADDVHDLRTGGAPGWSQGAALHWGGSIFQSVDGFLPFFLHFFDVCNKCKYS